MMPKGKNLPAPEGFECSTNRCRIHASLKMLIRSSGSLICSRLSRYLFCTVASGRPSKFSPQLAAKILDAIKAGQSLDVAGKPFGIHRSAIRRWLIMGRHASEGSYHDFFQAYCKLRASPNGSSDDRPLEGWPLEGRPLKQISEKLSAEWLPGVYRSSKSPQSANAISIQFRHAFQKLFNVDATFEMGG
jgi:hypothetical protein